MSIENLQSEHIGQCLIQNINPNTPIYRIFSLEYGLKTVLEKKLTLVRPSLWDDPYENALYQRSLTSGNASVSIQSLRDCLYAQCWTEEGNSDALWRIYSPLKNGFRLTTTVGKLIKAILDTPTIRKSDCFIGKVNYCHQNVLNELFARINILDLTDTSGHKPIEFLLIKRNAYQHEREVRIAYNYPSSSANPHGKTVSFDINPNELFDSILFDPRIDDPAFSTAKEQIEASGFKNPVAKSNLYEKPNFEAISIPES